MRNTCIAKNIATLRKKRELMQEQLATAFNISPQAISKWETGTSIPDTQMLSVIADYFDVSMDYLFYGKQIPRSNIYDEVFRKVASHPQMSREAYDDALLLFAHAHHGISHGNIRGREASLYDSPAHISDESGLSLLSGKGVGAIITRAFLENVDRSTLRFAMTLLPVLAQKVRLLVIMAIVSMSDISFGELKETCCVCDEELRRALDALIAAQLVVEKKSKHPSLGVTYEINSMYHTCICLLLATIEMQRYSLEGISCCMGYGDYPIALHEKE